MRLAIVSTACLIVVTSARAALGFPGPGQQYFVKEDLGKLPGHTRSSAHAINSSRVIVGESGFSSAAFVWTPPGPMVELDPNVTTRSGQDINELGQIAGDAFDLIYVYDAFRFTPPGTLEPLPGPPEILFDEYASAINESGVVVGSWEAPPLRACIWYPGEPDGDDLGTLGGTSSYATDITDGGAVVGASEITGDSEYHGFYWTEFAGMINLGDGGLGSTGSEARAVNNNSQIVGEVRYGSTTHVAYWPAPGLPLTDLGVIGGNSGRAYDISTGGTIVGRTTINASAERRAFRKRPNASMTQLGTLGGSGSEAHGISDQGHIVGEAGLANGETHAVVWWLYTVPYSYSCQCQMTPPPWPPGFFQIYLATTVNLNARDIDPKTLTLGDSEDDLVHVATDPFTGEPLARLVDVTGDGNLDLVVQFSEEELRREGEWTPETVEFWMQGATYDRSRGVEGIVQVDPTGTPGSESASDVTLRAPSPNPVTNAATIVFEMPRAGSAELVIYDTSGRHVMTLASGLHGAGPHVISWDRRDTKGRVVGAGVYVARLRALGRDEAAKLVVID